MSDSTNLNSKPDDKAIDTFLSLTKSEYDNENSRIASRDLKISIALPIMSTYLFSIPPTINYQLIFSTEIHTFADLLKVTIHFITSFGSLSLALIAICFMLYIILPKEYNDIDPKLIHNHELLEDNILLSFFLAEQYINATFKNRTQNSKRAKHYKHSCVLFTISIFLFIMYNIIKNIT